MNYLDVYLKKNKCSRDKVHLKTGIDEDLLLKHTKKQAKKYSDEVLAAIANTLSKSPNEVINEISALEKENPPYEAFTKSELLTGLSEKWDYIIIKGDLVQQINTMMKGQLSETEMMGFEIGSGGTATIVASAIDAIRELFSNEKKEKIDKDIEKKLKIYKVKQKSSDSILLGLKQLDY